MILLAAVFCASAGAAEVNFRFFPTGQCLPPLIPSLCPASQRAGIAVFLEPTAGTVADSYDVTMAFTIVMPAASMAPVVVSSTGSATVTVPGTSNIAAILPYSVSDLPNVVINSITVAMHTGAVDSIKMARNPVPGPIY